MNAVEAKAFGIVDHILGNTSNIVLSRQNNQIELAGSLLQGQRSQLAAVNALA
jgi:hypothetical protein